MRSPDPGKYYRNSPEIPLAGFFLGYQHGHSSALPESKCLKIPGQLPLLTLSLGLLCFLMTLSMPSNAQYSLTPQNKLQARYEIDAKRIGVTPTDKDALPRSREFIRLDSTYYVGWMYEGIYKYDRSADYLGYKNAIPSLEKALNLLDRDYSTTLKNMYSTILYFSQNVQRYQDLYMIFTALEDCYDNIEMPDSSMALIDKMDKYHFQKDYFHLYYRRAWICHRNRFYTSAKYKFLKNSVQENEKLAFSWCYRGFSYIEKYRDINDAWFGPNQAEQDKIPLYHNLALLHCYNKNYDSSEYYYDKLKADGGISWNNYGGLQSEIGNFANAEEDYGKDLDRADEHMLREPYYYIPELYVYAGRTRDAIAMTQEIINESGSTPGFGWYNIALGRSYLYDGQLDSAELVLDKAANFKELHIGTTLTQQQYDFTINLLRVQLIDKKIAAIEFLNKGWWYSPTDLYNIASLKINKMLAEYIVVNELAFNPERNRLVYDLFCSESTTTFDEAWYLLKDFSPAYFEKKYEHYQQTDKRENIQRYFKLFAAKFKWENGEKTEATKDYAWIVNHVMLDTATEKLFLARLYEGLARAYTDNGDQPKAEFYKNEFFQEYPQLVPYSGIRLSMNLSVSGNNDPVTREVIGEMKQCNINWVKEENYNTPQASVTFIKKGGAYEAVFNVKTGSGKPVVSNGSMVFKSPEGVGNELALRLFGKGGVMVYEKPSGG